MNGNPTYHAIALAAGTLLVLPVPLAILTGWTPRGLRGRRLAARPYAWAVLCLTPSCRSTPSLECWTHPRIP
ncbi:MULTISPECIES: hypothetical protein [unclassified Streptomyces]|uniref:hypothetical protein n=1 Tax=unclassified Streptomyces TaxID=2593676 RepID=UPI0022520FA9|nr:hypothetical protein [Streptomyces sp. NBC_00047]MCX5613405.1 hypothetical protein [Streptomyces sp. NBC_00047]